MGCQCQVDEIFSKFVASFCVFIVLCTPSSCKPGGVNDCGCAQETRENAERKLLKAENLRLTNFRRSSFVRSFVRSFVEVPSFLCRSFVVRSFVRSFVEVPSFLRSFVEVPSLLRSLVVPLFLRSLFLCLFLRRSFVVPLSFAVPLFVLRPYFHCSFFVCSLLRSGSASVEQFIILPSSCLRHPFVIPSSLLCPSSSFAVLRWTLAGS